MDVIRNDGKTQRTHFCFTPAPIILSLHTWGSCSHGAARAGAGLSTDDQKGTNVCPRTGPGQPRALLGFTSLHSGALPEPPRGTSAVKGREQALQEFPPHGELSPPLSLAHRSFFLGNLFILLFHLGERALVRGRRAPALRHRPPRALGARSPLPRPPATGARARRDVSARPLPGGAALCDWLSAGGSGAAPARGRVGGKARRGLRGFGAVRGPWGDLEGTLRGPGTAMQAFLKGPASISTKPVAAKEKSAAGSSGEGKRTKPIPWVEK